MQFIIHLQFDRLGKTRTLSRLSVPLHEYRGTDKSLARPTDRCILFDGDNISFNDSLVLYI